MKGARILRERRKQAAVHGSRGAWFVLALWVALWALLLASCGGGSGGGPADTGTTYLQVAVSIPDSPVPANISPLAPKGVFTDVQSVLIEVYAGAFTLPIPVEETPISSAFLAKIETPPSSGIFVWQGPLSNLPLGSTVTFVGRAYNVDATVDPGNLAITANEIFQGAAVTALSESSGPLTLSLAPIDDGTGILIPSITSIALPAQVGVDQSEAIQVNVSGQPNESLPFVFTSGGGGFAPASGSVVLNSSGLGAISTTYTAPSTPALLTHSVQVSNAQGSSVAQSFDMDVVTTITNPDVNALFAPVVTAIELERFDDHLLIQALIADDQASGLFSSDSGVWAFTQTAGTPGADFCSNGASCTLPLSSQAGDLVRDYLFPYDQTVGGEVSVTITDSDGLSTTVTFQLDAGLFPDLVLATLYNFESGRLAGWTPTDLWHVSDQDGVDPFDSSLASLRSLRFGDPGGATIDDGVAGVKTGTVTSPLLSSGGAPVLRFDYRHTNGCNLLVASPCTENQLFVVASFDGGATWPFSRELDQGAFSGWRHLEIDLGTENAGFFNQPDVLMRFSFDSVTDTSGSSFEGPFVDNVVLEPNFQSTLIALTVTPDQPYVESSSTYQLRAWGTYADGSLLEISDRLDWSATGSVTAVNTDGVKGSITTSAAASGTTGTITATDPISGLNSSVTVRVQDMTAGPTETLYQLSPRNNEANNYFGYDVALSGNRALIGAYPSGEFVSNGGAVYVMERDEFGVWGAPVLLPDPGLIGPDRFGISVALEGDWAIVGSSLRDPGGLSGAGSAFIYQRDPNTNTWAMVQELTASDKAAGDEFGQSVTIHGETALVGAWRKDDGINGLGVGAAYLFQKGRDGVWRQQSKLMAPVADRSGEARFGWSVALEGDIAVVGGYFTDSGGLTDNGAVYIFERTNGDWDSVSTTSLYGSDDSSHLGYAVDIDRGRVLAGEDFAYNISLSTPTGSATLFEKGIGGVWQPTHTFWGEQTGENFGFDVAISGNNVLIGAYSWEPVFNTAPLNLGRGFLFTESGDVWGTPANLTTSNSADGDWFGFSLDIDGSLSILSAHRKDDAALNVGAIYIFE